ncbi:MAG: ROK family protein, partial [Lentisphaeria bacterium]|nr:ROK family protein [Lentisphaeria bacterium]
MNEYTLGIDLGGTKIYAVVVDRDYKIVSDAKMNTPSHATPDELAEAIVALGRKTLEPLGLTFAELDGIGVAIPAPVDPVTGDCLHATNLGIRNFSMKEKFRELTGRDVYLGNDGSLGILAEYHCGAARGYRTVIGYYIGTGLGGGIIIEGRLHTGNAGLAGEFGHAIIKYKGRRCGCGHRGCAEAYCSKTALSK